MCIERKVVRKKDGVMKKGDGEKKGKLCINKKIVYKKVKVCRIENSE